MASETPDAKNAQPPIPTHPPDPAAAGEEEKVLGEPALQTPDYNAPPPPDAVKSTGQAQDAAGGAGLGQPPGKAGEQSPNTTRAQDSKAEDLQDRRP